VAAKEPIYVEAGAKRVFAGALNWPGWQRAARDEDAALEVLIEYGPRYARVLRGTKLGFAAPASRADLRIAERLPGNATTDFGAPDAAPKADARRLDAGRLSSDTSIVKASWRAFERAAAAADGVVLRKGPRGGGRDLRKIVDHVVGAQESYLRMLGRKVSLDRDDMPDAVLEVLVEAVRDGVPASPRGGKRWTPGFFVRRSVWHILDHAWEIEDRTPD
jgi:hypothetical protein